MAKRFIDTGLFDDPWFSDLSSNGKLFWVYFLTKCDNAGLMKYNKKLMSFQTSIRDVDTVIQELGNRLIRVSEELIFCPKFIEFQYPGFPKSKAPQQKGACQLLVKAEIMNPETLEFIDEIKTLIRVKKELPNSNGDGNGNGNEIGKGESFEPDFENYPHWLRKPLKTWWEYKVQKRSKYVPKGWDTFLQSVLKNYQSESELMAAVEHSMSNNWQGLFKPDIKTEVVHPQSDYNDDDWHNGTFQ